MLTDREISLLFSALYRILGALDPSHRELLTKLCEASDSRYVSMVKLARALSEDVAPQAAIRSATIGIEKGKSYPYPTIPDGALVWVSGHPGGNFTARVESSEMIDGALHYALVNGAGAKPMWTHYHNVRRVEEKVNL